MVDARTGILHLNLGTGSVGTEPEGDCCGFSLGVELLTWMGLPRLWVQVVRSTVLSVLFDDCSLPTGRSGCGVVVSAALRLNSDWDA